MTKAKTKPKPTWPHRHEWDWSKLPEGERRWCLAWELGRQAGVDPSQWLARQTRAGSVRDLFDLTRQSAVQIGYRERAMRVSNRIKERLEKEAFYCGGLWQIEHRLKLSAHRGRRLIAVHHRLTKSGKHVRWLRGIELSIEESARHQRRLKGIEHRLNRCERLNGHLRAIRYKLSQPDVADQKRGILEWWPDAWLDIPHDIRKAAVEAAERAGYDPVRDFYAFIHQADFGTRPGIKLSAETITERFGHTSNGHYDPEQMDAAYEIFKADFEKRIGYNRPKRGERGMSYGSELKRLALLRLVEAGASFRFKPEERMGGLVRASELACAVDTAYPWCMPEEESHWSRDLKLARDAVAAFKDDCGLGLTK